jgi:hypothetical protein
MDVIIRLQAKLHEDLTQYRGCPIVDTDLDEVYLRVDSGDLYTNYTYREDLEPVEFWGQKGVERIGSLDIRQCLFWGRPVLNAEEVIEQIVEER